MSTAFYVCKNSQPEFTLSSLRTLKVWTFKQRYCIEPKKNQEIILWLNNTDKPTAKVQDNNNNNKKSLEIYVLAWNLEYKINKTIQLTRVPKLNKIRSREGKYNKRCFKKLTQLVKMLAINPCFVPQNFQNRECWLL